MVDVRPFRGLRFAPSQAPDLSRVICPPYDVIGPTEQDQLHRRHPHNVVRLELGLDELGDDEQRNRYTRAAETLEQWRSQGVLELERQPSLYLHLERFVLDGAPRERRDLIAAVRLADWSEGQVLPHERTMDRPKADRFRLLQATATQLSPVWSLFREPSPALDSAWQAALGRPPDHRFTDDEQREHQLWALSDAELVSAIARDFSSRTLYIADGHHRYETALHYRREHRTDGGLAGADAAYEFVMMWLTAADDPGLVVLPTHRLLHVSERPDPETIESALAASLRLQRFSSHGAGPEQIAHALLAQMDRRTEPHAMGMYGPGLGQFALLTPRDPTAVTRALPAERSSAWRELDVAVLHTLVVELLLGSAESVHESLSYTRDPVEACRAVQQGAARLALFLKPTPVSQVLAVAEAGDRMPEKSTYFHPKPPTGLVLYPLRDA